MRTPCSERVSDYALKEAAYLVDQMLDRLGTDYLDLLYIHRWDDDTPVEEFMRTLNEFVDAGKVNYLGASTMYPNAWKVAKANELAERRGYEPFTITQPRYNLADREVEANYLDMCGDYELGVCPWSPLGQGFLTGKYSRDTDQPDDSKVAREDRFRDNYLTEENFELLDVLQTVSDEVDAAPAQVAIAWLQHHDRITVPLLGARTVEQLEENLAAASVELSQDQFDRLAEAKDHPLSSL